MQACRTKFDVCYMTIHLSVCFTVRKEKGIHAIFFLWYGAAHGPAQEPTPGSTALFGLKTLSKDHLLVLWQSTGSCPTRRAGKWKVVPPPPPHFLSVYFFSVSFLCHGKPRWGYVLMGPVTVWNRLTPTILVFEYLDPPSWRNWIFSALQTRLTEEPIYVTPPPSPPAHDRLRQDRSRLLSSSPLPPPSPSCCKRARLSTAL